MTRDLQTHIALPFDRQAVSASIIEWSKGATDVKSARYADIIRMKQASVAEFFNHCEKHPAVVTGGDVRTWVESLRDDASHGRKMSESTIYHMYSRLKAFYAYLVETGFVRADPVSPVKVKAPKAYSSEKIRALSDDEQTALMQVVRKHADDGEIAAIRDYAYLYWLMTSGHRMNEILQLTMKLFSITGTTVKWTTRVKGGNVINKRAVSKKLADAIQTYVRESGRFLGNSDAPLWLSHDPQKASGNTSKPTGSGNRVKSERNQNAALSRAGMMKSCAKWAKEAGIQNFHLHMLRHTVATQVSEETGSIKEVQEVLGHANESITRRYVHRLGEFEVAETEALKRNTE